MRGKRRAFDSARAWPKPKTFGVYRGHFSTNVRPNASRIRIRWRRCRRNIKGSLGTCEARSRRPKSPRDVSSVDINIGRYTATRLVGTKQRNDELRERENRIRSIRANGGWGSCRESRVFLCQTALSLRKRSPCSLSRHAFTLLQPAPLVQQMPFNNTAWDEIRHLAKKEFGFQTALTFCIAKTLTTLTERLRILSESQEISRGFSSV